MRITFDRETAAAARMGNGLRILGSESSGVWSLAAREKSEGVASTDRKGPARKPRRGGEPHIGQALRSVWDETLGEQIPADMLDLLGKLN